MPSSSNKLLKIELILKLNSKTPRIILLGMKPDKKKSPERWKSYLTNNVTATNSSSDPSKWIKKPLKLLEFWNKMLPDTSSMEIPSNLLKSMRKCKVLPISSRSTATFSPTMNSNPSSIWPTTKKEKKLKKLL